MYSFKPSTYHLNQSSTKNKVNAVYIYLNETPSEVRTCHIIGLITYKRSARHGDWHSSTASDLCAVRDLSARATDCSLLGSRRRLAVLCECDAFCDVDG